jgi:hypothetical protein
MRLHSIFLASLAAFTLPHAVANAATSGAPDARTVAAVEAANRVWGAAEEAGNDAFIDWLLLSGVAATRMISTTCRSA